MVEHNVPIHEPEMNEDTKELIEVAIAAAAAVFCIFLLRKPVIIPGPPSP